MIYTDVTEHKQITYEMPDIWCWLMQICVSILDIKYYFSPFIFNHKIVITVRSIAAFRASPTSSLHVWSKPSSIFSMFIVDFLLMSYCPLTFLNMFNLNMSSSAENALSWLLYMIMTVSYSRLLMSGDPESLVTSMPFL